MATLGRKDTYALENYKKGTRVWLRDNEHVWLRADLLEDLKLTTQTFKLKREIDDEIVEEKLNPEALPFLANPEILIGKDDLTNMSYLHEPAVLHNLRFRFEKKKAIYTYCGIVLVAINPYADCSQIYSDDVISIYGNAGNQGRADLDPHIYAISAEAYYDMREYEKNQSIIVSGESGAGKTVSAKFVMKYLANVAGSKKPRRSSDGSPGIESRVLASNPIMESIGNAKTIRNDNSSRFGKFIQINFAEDFSIAGAEMKTYLLEKSRVVFQSKNERNYHVFYQMCAASSHPLLTKLDLLSSEDYLYTNQGQDPIIPGVDDAKDFSELTKAFDMLKIDQKRQAEIFQIFAGVLLLGNLQFEPTGNGEQSTISRNSSSIIDKLCDQSIFNVEATPLKTWLSAREIRAGSEVVRKHLNVNDASANRDALAKMIYACMFNWIVDKINESLDHQHNASKSSRRVKASKFIGVLDIYGFETFDINSFEQFCINYANEKLQQQFNQHVFKLEQQEYEREEISWVRIDFYDNQPCIDLIEAQPGIISYLDEQCKMGRGTDEDWLNLMKNCPKLKKSSHLVMPKFKDPSFLVKHFAADVSYRIDGFLEKNKDTVNEQLLGVFAKTQFSFLKEVIHHVLDTSSTGAKRKKTVAIQFKESLSELINVLSVTRPHYVRCIKPNDEKEYFYFEPKRAIQQLRACGVLETVRISAAGYPSRWAYDEFGRRYRVLYPEGKALWKHKPKDFAKLACEKWLEPEKYALGKTKMFFRVGILAQLEKHRQEILSDSAIKIQKIWRGFVARRRYLQMMSSIRTIQAATRAFLAYRRLKYLQMHRAAICIQSAWRGFREKQKYNSIRNAIISIQAAFRGREVRRRVLAIKYEKSAVTIQRYFRGFLVRREQIKRIRKIIKVQCCIRRFLAKRQLKKLKAERTTVLFWENKHQSLEKKIVDMQQKLDAMATERNQYAVRCSTLDEVKAQCDRLLAERDELLAIKDIKEMQDIQMKELNAKVDAQSIEIQNITRKFNEELSASRDIKEMQDIQLVQLNDQLTSQATEMDEITQKFTDLTILNESYKSQIESLTSNQLKELEILRENYTKLEENYRKIDSQLYAEKEKVKRIESEKNEMRQQLASNADLLVSEFTRGSDLRNSMRSISSDGTTVDSGTTDSQTVIKQYELIRELNSKVQSMQREKENLMNKCMHFQNEVNANHYSTKETYDSLKSQELEMENAKLKRDIAELCMNRGKAGMDDYITQIQETLENRQQENIELRALLANVYERGSRHSPKPDGDDYGYHSTENSDDGTNSTTDTYIDDILEKERLLRNTLKENEILAKESASKDDIIADLEDQIRNLTNIHHDGASETSSSNTSSMIQTKVLCDNMLLQQKVNRQSDELYELRSQLRGYSSSSESTASDQHQGDGDFIRLLPLQSTNTHSGYLHVFNVPEFARVLIYELKPRIAKQLTPCLPAYLLLAGFRFYDREKDETAITGLFAAAQSVLKEIAANSNDADILSLWLINSWRLFNLLRQYSSEENEEWNAQNTEKQNSHKITNFNVEPLRNQLKIRIEVFYQSFMKKTVEPLLSPKIVPGVLQHDSSQLLAGSNGPSHSGLTRQLSKDVVVQRALDDLIALLNVVYNKLQAFGADTVLIKQTFWQITKWICAQALNNLMFRKDLCKFEKAIQIKHNVSELQNWLYQKGLGDIRAVLEPLVQACHLLQSRKDEGNLETLCGEMTSELNAKQVVSILQHYTPSDGFEEDAIDMEFLIKVQTRLVARAAANGDDIEDKEKLILPGTFVNLETLNKQMFQQFVYSDVNLETLTLPPSLHLNNVARFA